MSFAHAQPPKPKFFPGLCRNSSGLFPHFWISDPAVIERLLLTSRLGREFTYPGLVLQGFALISPFKGFSHCAIEVIDEFKNAGFELSFTDETSTSLVTCGPKY